jgi:hypothetical protein
MIDIFAGNKLMRDATRHATCRTPDVRSALGPAENGTVSSGA